MILAPDESARRPLRFVVLGESIISDLGNPIATSARAILTALAESGHEVTFLEQRGNPSYLAALKQRGSRFTREFAQRHPGIQVRTYDLPKGWERTVWMGREVGTADVVIAMPGTPQELLPEIIAYPSHHIVSFIDDTFPVEHDRFRLVRSPDSALQSSFWFGPAVLPTSSANDRLPNPVIVAYDDVNLGLKAERLMQDRNPVTICSGSAELPGWQYLPEVELPELYLCHKTAYVATAATSGWTYARSLLPIASGCHSLSLLDESILDIGQPESSPPILHVHFDARLQARVLVGAARQALLRS